jgi:predicted Holliday junction resolvase-like endonuclease
MDVVIGLALLGLFVFLGLRYKSYSFTKQAETRLNEVIDQAARHTLELENRLAQALLRAQEADRLESELKGYRQMTESVISSDMHEALVAEHRVKAESVSAELEKVKNELDSVKGKQISERVRLGQVSENVTPFLSAFPYDPKRVRGLFQPIDLLVFNDDEIVFVEVKTGDAALTEKQRNIKRLIDEGKVRFEIHRLNDKGYEIK